MSSRHEISRYILDSYVHNSYVHDFDCFKVKENPNSGFRFSSLSKASLVLLILGMVLYKESEHLLSFKDFDVLPVLFQF